MNDFSANEFEKRALLGFAPVHADGSFRIQVPANTPISFATLDEHGRGFVVKRTHLYVRPGEEFTKCVGCHEDRAAGGPVPTNPTPMAAHAAGARPELDPGALHGHQLRRRHRPDRGRQVRELPSATIVGPGGPIPPPANLDLTAVPDTTTWICIFPRGYINLSGESMRKGRKSWCPASRAARC